MLLFPKGTYTQGLLGKKLGSSLTGAAEKGGSLGKCPIPRSGEGGGRCAMGGMGATVSVVTPGL